MSILSNLKNMFPLDTKLKVNALLHPKNAVKLSSLSSTKRKRIYVFLAGFYQNLGDMAITLAQRNFMQELYPDAKVIWISNEDTYQAIRVIKKHISSDDLITVIGGGNMSDSYIHLETSRRHVVKSFPKNKIVLFPQTMFFGETEEGKRELLVSKQVYERHSNLIMFARERDSFERMKACFPKVDIRLAPDIVLSLDKRELHTQRDGVLCCLRTDKEKNMTAEEREQILSSLKTKFKKVLVTDTTDVTKEECREEQIEATLEKFWNKIKVSRLVVTDRLHCMIFCVITGTPCIAVDNANHKLSGVYNEWLRECPGIHMTELQDIDSFIKECERVYQNECMTVKYVDLNNKFEVLRIACKE